MIANTPHSESFLMITVVVVVVVISTLPSRQSVHCRNTMKS